MAARVVATRGDTYLGGSPHRCFRLQRVLLNEVRGCGDLVIFSGKALILHEIEA